MRQHSWTRVQPRGSQPSARYLHSAVVVGDTMVVFGGFLEWQGDVWSFSFSSQRWTKLSEVRSLYDAVHVACWQSPAQRNSKERVRDSKADAGGCAGQSTGGLGSLVSHTIVLGLVQAVQQSAGGPGGLQAHTASATADGSGFIVHGGRPVGEDHTSISTAVWAFNIADRKWTQLHHQPEAAGPPAAPGLIYAAMDAWQEAAVQTNATTAVIVGGSVRSPVMLCSTDTWLVTASQRDGGTSWMKIISLPMGIYSHKLVVHDNAAYVFGGHLCPESKGDLPFYYSNTMMRLELTSWLAPKTLKQTVRNLGPSSSEL